ncbi:asparagine synthase (glutamine-hydrolyzing) [Microbacterium luticocti]|uniref:asparagine synthase (glutamine-hydrolyzing) n=1 Tax=Microbacterium luticocti TaxID=451764 RepID=UPI00042462E8|nr:asparagine synthase (glutamine-hydrolyzing) [Microbacterium luticocti]
MCGIAGVYSPDAVPDLAAGLAMVGALAHRGPDGSGCYRDERVLLGHTRLAIVDTGGGAQPLCNEDGTVWVAFNGEIFNHVELAAELAAHGHVFRTRSDTEVIVHAWEQWGSGCFARFNGQWAIALWDRPAGALVLSRDRLGVRPLYWTRAGARVLFASEVKALFTDPDVPRGFDAAGICDVLSLWAPLAPRTVFDGVHQLPPGCWARLDEHGMHVEEWWSPDFPDRGTEPDQDLHENIDRLRQAVTDATGLRFARSDVPVGAYLSGGIDSAVTASVIAGMSGVDLHTFSLRFADAEFDEGPHQERIARRLGTVHESVTVTADQIGEVFPDVVRHAETVLLRTAPAPMYLLSQLVHGAGYKVVVTGEGADEVLAGYDIFREARVRDFVARDPGSPARATALGLLYPWMVRNPAAAPAFAQAFFGQGHDPADPARSHRPRWRSTAVLQSMLTADVAAQAVTSVAGTDEVAARLAARGAGWDPLAQAQWLEMTTLLPGYILAAQGDRMLMAHSVEGRFPFLDHRVVEAAARIPARQKMLGLHEKHVLKQAFADLVPDEIRDRPKQPYRAPDASSFFGGGAGWFADLLDEAALRRVGVFRPEVVAALVAKCRRSGGRGLSNTDNMRMVAVASAQLLATELLDAPYRAPAPPEPLVVHDLVGAGTSERI